MKDKLGYIRELLTSQKIDADDFREMKAEYADKLEKLQGRLYGIGEDNTDLKSLLKMGVQNVFRLKYIYLAGDIAKKREVIGSIYPEKFEIENFVVRTAYVNEIVRLIYTLDEGFSDPEKGNGSKKSSRSGLVALPGQFSNLFMQDLKLLARL